MTEAMENLQTVHEVHKRETVRLQEVASAQSKHMLWSSSVCML